MTKKHFIAIADHIKMMKSQGIELTHEQISSLGDFLASQNRNFIKSRWMEYIKGNCGPCGGSIK